MPSPQLGLVQSYSHAAVCVPARHRGRAILAGAALGTLPDLDVLIDYGDAVANFTSHRSFSHSLFVLPLFALCVWIVLRRWWTPVRESPGRWLAAIVLALTTHPILDAHTAYGTQLLWPLDMPPIMWSTIFIIDPLYTLPLLAGVVVFAVPAWRRLSGRALVVGVVLSTAYLGWSWSAKLIVERHAREALVAMGFADAPMFSAPLPFNTALWRVVVLTEDGYLEGFDSLLIDEGRMEFQAYPRNDELFETAQMIGAVQRLRWFAHDFIKAEIDADQLIVSDLRMGYEPKYVFRYAVAERGNPRWRPIEPRHIRTLFTRDEVVAVWRRMFEP